MTTLTPELAVSIGYTARDGIRRTRVHTAVGSEDGFLLLVAELTAPARRPEREARDGDRCRAHAWPADPDVAPDKLIASLHRR